MAFLIRGEQRQAMKKLRRVLQVQMKWDANIPNLTNASKLTRTAFFPNTGTPSSLAVAQALVTVITAQLAKKAKWVLTAVT